MSSNGSLVLSFLVFLLLARLLGPASFGLVAIATVFLDLSASLARAGLPEAVVQRRDLTATCLDTAFWLSLGSGVAFCLVLSGSSGYAAAAFAMPELEPVLQALSLCFVISGLGAVHEAQLLRSFGFKRLAVRNLGATVLAGMVAVAMALTGWGIWSLVVQRLAHALSTTVLSWLALRWLPRLRFRWSEARGLLGFGGAMLGSNLLLALNGRLHEIIAGLFLDAAAVGYLRVGWRCIELMMQVALSPLVSIALPLLSRLQGEPLRLRRTLLQFIGTAALVAFPVFAGFGVLATDLVPLVFGEQWTPAVGIAEILCLLVIPAVPNAFAWPALAAMNKAGWAFLILALQVVAGAGLSLAAVQLGVAAMAASHVLRAFLAWPFAFAMLGRVLGVGMGEVVGALARPLLIAVAMALAVHAASSLLTAELGALPALALCVAMGAALYAGLAMLLLQDAIRPVLGAVGGRLQHLVH